MTDHRPAEPAQLALELDDRPDTHIYVASALTALEPTERSQISRRCDIIDQAIVASSGSIGKPWKVHLPVLWSAPGPDDDRTPREIYNFNRDHVRRATGLVLLGDHGGSLGAGQEFAWAIARRLPVLVLLTGDEPLSRQITGTPAQMSEIAVTVFQRLESDPEVLRAGQQWTSCFNPQTGLGLYNPVDVLGHLEETMFEGRISAPDFEEYERQLASISDKCGANREYISLLDRVYATLVAEELARNGFN